MNRLEDIKDVVKALFEIGAYSLGLLVIVLVGLAIAGYFVGGILIAKDRKKEA